MHLGQACRENYFITDKAIIEKGSEEE